MSARTTADDVVEQATKEVLEALTLIRSARNRIEQITVDQCWGA